MPRRNRRRRESVRPRQLRPHGNTRHINETVPTKLRFTFGCLPERPKTEPHGNPRRRRTLSYAGNKTESQLHFGAILSSPPRDRRRDDLIQTRRLRTSRYYESRKRSAGPWPKTSNSADFAHKSRVDTRAAKCRNHTIIRYCACSDEFNFDRTRSRLWATARTQHRRSYPQPATNDSCRAVHFCLKKCWSALARDTPSETTGRCSSRENFVIERTPSSEARRSALGPRQEHSDVEQSTFDQRGK